MVSQDYPGITLLLHPYLQEIGNPALLAVPARQHHHCDLVCGQAKSRSVPPARSSRSSW